MEVRSHPRGVVHHRIHAVAHVDEPAAAAEPQHKKRQACRQHHRLVPGHFPDPAEQSGAAIQSSGDLERGADRKDCQQCRNRHERCQKRLQEFEPG